MARWPQIGVPIGLLLGTGAMTAIALSAEAAFKAWAWRIPDPGPRAGCGDCVAGALELFLIPAFGNLSDRLGRRRVYATGAVLMAVVAFPFFALLDTATAGLVILGVALSAIPHAMQYGPQSSYIAEQFPTGLAYAGSGLGYQAASLIAGGPAPLLATWMLPNFGWQAISVYIIACAVLTLTAVILLPDRSKHPLALTPILTPSASRLGSN